MRRRIPLAVLCATAAFLAACAPPGRPPSESAPTGSVSPLVDPSEIVPGGPPPDGIPPIDHPTFEPVSAVDWLAPSEPVIAIDLGGDARAYPAQILIWHEIVNDQVAGRPIAVTYCPLCNTGVAFARPTVDGRVLDFGTSGKLYRSNLVMYDRQTRSLWPQVTGQAVVGPLTGMKLELVPVQMVAWSDWRDRHPDGTVLSRETGVERDYGSNPYVGYDREDSTPFLFGGSPDPRLPPKARVVGVLIGDDAMAFPYDTLRESAVGGWSAVTTTVGGRSVLVVWKAGAVSAVDQAVIRRSRDVGSTGVFDPMLDGTPLMFEAAHAGVVDRETGSTWDIFGRAVAGPMEGSQLNLIISIESFWFDWAGFHPDTRIFGS